MKTVKIDEVLAKIRHLFRKYVYKRNEKKLLREKWQAISFYL